MSSGADIGCPRDFLRRPYLSLSAVPWDFPEFIPLFVLIQLLRRPPAKGPLFRAASLCDMAVHRVWSNTEINTPVYAEIPRDYLKMGNCSFSNYFFPVCWINLHRIAIPWISVFVSIPIDQRPLSSESNVRLSLSLFFVLSTYQSFVSFQWKRVFFYSSRY